MVDLSLPTQIFPPGSVTAGMQRDSSDDLEVIEYGYQIIYWNPPGSAAGYDVNHYVTEALASEGFGHEKLQLSEGQPGNWKPWPTPPSLTYSSPKADEFHMACGSFARVYKCGMVVRYHEYVATFWSGIDDQMTEQRFNDVVGFIDERLAERLHP